MEDLLALDPRVVAAIVVMAVITYATRIAGLFIAGRLSILTGPLREAFDAIPPAVLIAVIAPTVLGTGVAETAAALITALAATRLPLLATIATGVAAVVLLRMVVG